MADTQISITKHNIRTYSCKKNSHFAVATLTFLAFGKLRFSGGTCMPQKKSTTHDYYT